MVADGVEASLISGVSKSDGDSFGADVEDGAFVDEDLVGAVGVGDQVALLLHPGAVFSQVSES